MNFASAMAIAYGIIALIGGILGYVKAKSQISLISGSSSGALLILGGIAQAFGQNWGLPLSIIITVLLVIVFTSRLIKTGKFMPAGLMTLLGIAALVVMLNQVFL